MRERWPPLIDLPYLPPVGTCTAEHNCLSIESPSITAWLVESGILEHAVHAIPSRPNTNKVIDEAMEAGLAADHPVTIAAKQVRLELLRVKVDLEREFGDLVLNCNAWGQEVH